MKGEINSNAVIVGEFNTLLTPMYRSRKQKIRKETQALNDILDQLDLIDTYRHFTQNQGISPKNKAFHLFLQWTRNILHREWIDRSHPWPQI